MRGMTLSEPKFHRGPARFLLAVVLSAGAFGAPVGSLSAAEPPNAELAAAAAAVAAAERAQARGDAELPLADARQRLAAAQDATARRKYRDAARLAAEAQAAAELA